MIAFVVVKLLAASPLMVATMLQSPAEPPAARRKCYNEKIANSRFMRRVCTEVAAKPLAKAEASPPPPPAAPAAPVMTTLGVGMAVVDGQGGAVGTITAVAADSVTVKTARHQAQLPKTSLSISEGKALFGMTQAELDASIEQSLAAKVDAGLKVGATVKDKDGASVGTIDAVDAANVTILLAGGTRINIPRSGIAIDAEGNGAIGLTAAELEAQIKAAQPAR